MKSAQDKCSNKLIKGQSFFSSVGASDCVWCGIIYPVELLVLHHMPDTRWGEGLSRARVHVWASRMQKPDASLHFLSLLTILTNSSDPRPQD